MNTKIGIGIFGVFVLCAVSNHLFTNDLINKRSYALVRCQSSLNASGNALNLQRGLSAQNSQNAATMALSEANELFWSIRFRQFGHLIAFIVLSVLVRDKIRREYV